MDMYHAKPGDVLADWETPVGPYVCAESAPAMPTDGDNPSYPSTGTLSDPGDQRNKSGGSNTNPVPGKVGALD